MQPLTLQLYHQGVWQDAARLSVQQPELGLAGRCNLAYQSDYLVEHLEALQTRLGLAVSANYPLSWNAWHLEHAPAFLLDILPAGAARRFLLARLATQRPQDIHLDLYLLSRYTAAPIGNLRIKESVQEPLAHAGFSRQDVVQREAGFVEYAYEQGAAIGGATGAGGEAPKLLLTEDTQGRLHPDAALEDTQAVQHWLVKFARNKASACDQDILRSEYCYYQAVSQIGLNTVTTQGMTLEEAHKPSLWMHRFDRAVTAAGVQRRAVESMYSLAQVNQPGAYMQHTDALKCLVELWRSAGQQDQVDELVFEYLRRDLLNQILGNSDNHGRNLAVLRTESGIELAPIYDLAPMVMDDEGITRTTKWPKPVEQGGQVDWLAACQLAGDWTDTEQLYQRLRHAAQEFLALPDLLTDLGLPLVTMNHPRIALAQLPKRLTDWGLL